MPARYLSDPELAGLSGWPDEIADVDAATYFTLSADDLSWLAGFNRQQNRRPIVDTAVAGLDSRRPRQLPAHGTRSAR